MFQIKRVMESRPRVINCMIQARERSSTATMFYFCEEDTERRVEVSQEESSENYLELEFLFA